MPKTPAPLVYVDTAVYLNVIKREPLFWGPALQVLQAARRGDIRLLASTLVLVELVGWKGDMDLDERDRVMDSYLLENSDVTWVEVDAAIALDARPVARRLRLRGPDASHLATAIRHSADYFMSNDDGYPYGTTVDHVRILRPQAVWQETIEDLEIESEAARETQPAAEPSSP